MTEGRLVGRAVELASLERVLALLLAGTQQVAFIEGEPGIGKSALLSAVATTATGRGFLVHSGRAQELDRDRPFGALIAAMGSDGLSASPAAAPSRALTDFAPSPADRHRTVDALIDRIAAETERSPVLLALDDVQWADASTILTVQQLNQRIPDTPLAIVLASRPIPKSPELRRLVYSLPPEIVTRIRLHELEPASVAQLTEQLTGHPPSALLLERAALAGGNPLYLKELMSALNAEKLIVERGGRSDVIGSDFPSSLTGAIIRRLAFLSDDSLRLLRWASVLGSTFRVDDLALVAGAPLAAIVDELAGPLDAGVLVDRGDRLGFSHDLVHDVVYRDIPAAVRAAMHVAVAEALAAAGRPAIDIAPHYSRGVREHNVPAAEWLSRAGRDVAGTSPQSAVDLFRRALELTAPGDALRASVALDLVRALLWSGEWAACEQLARDSLLTEADGPRVALLAFILGRSLVYRARTIESIEAVEQALASGRIDGDDTLDLLADLSIRLPLAGRLDDAETIGRRVLESRGEQTALARRTALSGMSLAAVVRGHGSQAVDLARSALPAGDHQRLDEAVEYFQPDFYYAIALTAADRLDDATRVLARLRRRTEEMGLAWAAGLSGILIGHIAYLRGAWDDALVELRTGLSLCAETGTAVWSVLGWSLIATIHARRGDHGPANEALAQATRLVAEGGRAHLWYERYLFAMSTLVASSGDGASAVAALEEGWLQIIDLNLVGARQVLGPPMARAAAAQRREDLVGSVARLMTGLDGDEATVGQRASALCCRAYAERSAELATTAAEMYGSVGRIVEAAEATEDAARLLIETGAPTTESANALSRALTTYESLGAATDIARLEQALRRAGVRRGVTGARRRPTTGWGSLTDTEREVVTLAAQGLTNREIADRLFVSHRTVASHLSNVFGKVGFSSRVELAAAVATGALANL